MKIYTIILLYKIPTNFILLFYMLTICGGKKQSRTNN